MKKIIIFLSVILISFPALAQQQLSLEECRKMAMENSKTLAIASKQIEKAQAGKKAAFSNYLPKISASGNIIFRDEFEMDLVMPTKVLDLNTGELIPNLMINPQTGQPMTAPDGTPIYNSYAWMPLELSLNGAYLAGIQLEQPLFTGGKIFYGNQAAGIGVEMAKSNFRMQQMNIINETDNAYWLYVSVKDKVGLAEQYIKLLDSLLITMNNSYEAGMVQKNEVMKVQVQYNSALLELQKAQSGLKLSRMALCRLIGLDLYAEIDASDSVFIGNDVLSSMGNEKVSNRPEYELLQKSVALEEKKIAIARANFLPTAGVQASYSYYDGIELNGSKWETEPAGMIIGSVSIPLWHWGEGINKVKTAKIERDIKTFEFENNVELLQLEIEKAKLDMIDALKRIELTKKSVEQAEENLRLSTNNYNAGMETMISLLDAQTQWKKAISNMIEAKVEYKIKESFYLKVSGVLAIEK